MEGSLYAQQVDDFYFSALSNGDEELFPISDEKYAEELQLQEVLMSATVASRFCSQTLPPPRPPLVQKVRLTGESSSSARTFCKICMETAVISEMFHSNNCSHAFCRNCLGRYIAAMINGNISTVRCPEIGCKGVLEPQLCQEIVPKEVFERWVDASCESMVLASHKYYCPFKDCSAMMVNTKEEAVTQSECPSCRRLFCARCNVPWHSGLSCNEFRGLGNDEKGREDLMLMEVAKSKAWKRCPRCKFFVEKTEGCMHITCRCGFEFCYGCGLKWSITHACCVNQRLYWQLDFLVIDRILEPKEVINSALPVIFCTKEEGVNTYFDSSSISKCNIHLNPLAVKYTKPPNVDKKLLSTAF